MNKLVLHHRYTLGSTLDLSGVNNHGAAQIAPPGNAPFAHSLRFIAPDSRVTVAPVHQLEQPIAIATSVRFFLDDASLARRYNLIEGHLSFALYIGPSGQLTGTILDRNGLWSGASSPPGAVQPGRWHQAWLLHDGISILELQLDGQTIGSSYAAPGPVRGVGPFGIAIGNWPDSGAYPFAGYLSEVRVYRYDLEEDVQRLLDPCCFDGAAFDSAVRQLRESGQLKALGRSVHEILLLLIRLTALLRGQDPSTARRVAQWSQAAFGALQRRDGDRLTYFHDLFEEHAKQNSQPDEIGSLQERFARLAADAGMTPELLAALARAACLRPPVRGKGNGPDQDRPKEHSTCR